MEAIKNREQRMRDHNAKQKNLAKMIGQNLSLYICIMIPVLLVGLIWTESSLPKLGWGLLGDGILTVALFVIGERSMLNVGIIGGKLDDEYIENRKIFREVVSKVKGIGILMLEPFCDWQTDMELERAKRTRCRRIGIKYDAYKEQYEGKTFEELKDMVGIEKATKLTEINKLKPIDLNPDLLLPEGGGNRERRDIPKGAEQYIEKKRYGKVGIAVSVFTAVFTVAISLAITKDITIARVLYTAVKLVALLFRMANGYNNGAKAYNTMEVRHLSAKIEYLDEYAEFMDKKLYLQIADQYPEIQKLISADPALSIINTMEENHEIPCQQPEEVPTDGGG